MTSDDARAPHLTLIRSDGTTHPAVPPLPASVTREHPLQIHIARPLLETILEDNIATLERHRAHIDVTPADRAATDHALDRMADLLAWVRGHQRWSAWLEVGPVDPTGR
ncbi:MAG TPA: hypothetical protein VFS40_15135 [Gemmatimonadales bacterium]|nr:hypothetical protein [Gemmatimonadales bacterium]